MRKWLQVSLATLIIIGASAILYTSLTQPDASEPNFQIVDVEISEPTIREQTNLMFYGDVKIACSFLYTAHEYSTYGLAIQNPNSPQKSVILTHYMDDREIIENLEIPPYAQYNRSYELLKGETFSGLLEISGGDDDLHLYIHCSNYTQSVDFSYTLSNLGSSDGYAVVELQSDGTSVWSNRYFLAAGASERFSGLGNVPDNIEHVFQIVVVEQSK